MNRKTYDICLAAGTASCTAGTGLLYGAGAALLTLGGLLIGLTLIGALMSRKAS